MLNKIIDWSLNLLVGLLITLGVFFPLLVLFAVAGLGMLVVTHLSSFLILTDLFIITASIGQMTGWWKMTLERILTVALFFLLHVIIHIYRGDKLIFDIMDGLNVILWTVMFFMERREES